MITPVLIGAGILLILEASRLFAPGFVKPAKRKPILPGFAYAASGRRESSVPARDTDADVADDSLTVPRPPASSAEGTNSCLAPGLAGDNTAEPGDSKLHGGTSPMPPSPFNSSPHPRPLPIAAQRGEGEIRPPSPRPLPPGEGEKA
jgi:hypothetical protein